MSSQVRKRPQSVRFLVYYDHAKTSGEGENENDTGRYPVAIRDVPTKMSIVEIVGQ